MSAEVEAKLHSYVRSVTTEIAGMGKAKISDDGTIMLLDVAIYEQEVTGGTADLRSEALAKFQTDLIRAGESPKDWIVWWHSHADMQAFFSSTDTTTIDGSDEFQILVSLVVNRRRERKARLDLYHPFRFTKDNLEIIVGKRDEVAQAEAQIAELRAEINRVMGVDVEIPTEIQTEVDEKVKVKTWHTGGGYKSVGETGFGFLGKHKLLHGQSEHGGKGFPARRSEGYESSLSGKGTELDYTGEEVDDLVNYVPEDYDIDEIQSILENLRVKIREHQTNQTTESEEYSELIMEAVDWGRALARRKREEEDLEALHDLHSKN